jgi:hypothetical protein
MVFMCVAQGINLFDYLSYLYITHEIGRVLAKGESSKKEIE